MILSVCITQPSLSQYQGEEFIRPNMAKETKQRTYTQMFRKQWLQDDIYKDWIAVIPNHEKSVLYKYSKTTFRAKYYDIKDHAKS